MTDDYSVIARAVSGLPSNTDEARREIYDRARRDEEIQSYVPNGPSHFDMNEAFCVRMHAAIAAGLESAPIGVVTTPGTKNPRYIPTKQSLALSQDEEVY